MLISLVMCPSFCPLPPATPFPCLLPPATPFPCLLSVPLGLLLNANWSIVSDMTLYIVIPPRRGVATATQILVWEPNLCPPKT